MLAKPGNQTKNTGTMNPVPIDPSRHDQFLEK